MKVLVTGAKGQLGLDVVSELKSKGHDVLATDIEEMEITNFTVVREVMKQFSPAAVVHCAAIAKPDDCENNVELAYRVNALGSRNVAVAAEELNAAIVYISTDYVFDGEKKTPYLEYDKTKPINQYGASKLAGEDLVRTLNRRHFVVRTAWLYGPLAQKNFVKTMLALAQKQNEVKVVNDQFGTPTYTADLAAQVARLLPTAAFGVYHGSGHGACTWFDFAKKVFETAGLKQMKVTPCSTAESNPKIRRPMYSVMRNLSFELEGLDVMRPWEAALADYFKRV